MPTLPRQDLDHVLEHVGEHWTDVAGSRVFITGGTGFIGKWLLETLLWANGERNLRVRVSLLTRDPARFQREAPHLATHPAVALCQGDVRTFNFPEGEFRYVIHAATERSFAPTTGHPAGTFDSDIEGTRRVLEFARQHGTRRFLFTSSGAVYGKQPCELSNVPEDYAGAPSTTDPGTAYGQAKRVSEFLCTMYARQHGFSALIARLFAFVGPHLPLNENFAVGNFMGDVLAGRPIHIKGDGTPYRSYLYAADMAIWLWIILTTGTSARPYNVGSAEPLSIAELARLVANVANPATKIEIAENPQPGAAPARYVPNVNRAASELGLVERIRVEESIRRTMEWHGGRRSFT